MGFNELKVPTYLGWATGYELGQPSTIQNGDVRCEITFCITVPALNYWSRNYMRSFGQSTDTKLIKFYEVNFEKFKKLLLIVLEELIQHYKGFLSPMYLTKKVWFCFDVGTYLASCEKLTKDFKAIAVFFNVDYLKINKSRIVNTIKHEIFHLISELHEGQENTIKVIDKLQNRLKVKIEDNKIKVYDGINELIDYCEKNSIDHLVNFKQIENYITTFYEKTTNRFWNLICDSALCVIAIELDDINFIKNCIKKDKEGVYLLRGRLNKVNRIIAHVIKNEPTEKRKNFLLVASKLLQFIICFEHMPYDAIAYGVLGEDWRPKKKRHFARNLWKSWHRNKSSKNIEDFKKIILQNCEPRVAEGFLRFYDSYLHIIEAQAIHNNPLNPNINQQIHNTESLKRGKEAYNTLNREFFKLFGELKKYE